MFPHLRRTYKVRLLKYFLKVLNNFIEICSEKRGELKTEIRSAKNLSNDEINNITQSFKFEKLQKNKKEKEAIEISKYWLDIIGLTHRADDDAGDLPYGDQRKLEIVRAMCINPHLLCLDEPAAGLNAKESAELNKLLLFIKNEKKTGILLIEHDMSVVMEISDHVVVLNYGKKIFQGSAKETKNSPEVIEAYLGTEE